MPFFVREPIRRWLQRLDAALTDTEQDVADLQTATTGLVPTSGQKAALAGTSGTPSSSNKYVTNNGFTPSAIGLGSVTNDAQLKRAGSDYSGITQQSGPTARTDMVLVERASDGAKRKVSSEDLTGISYVLRKPTTPNVWDDEFDDGLNSGSSDLLTRGWTVRNTTSASSMTRVGAISMASANGPGSALARNEYRSELRGSNMLFQFAASANDLIAVYKVVSHAAGAFRYALRARAPHAASVQGAACLFISNQSPPGFGAAQAHFVGHFYDTNLTGHVLRHWIASGSDSNNAQGFGAKSMDTFVWDNGSGFILDSESGIPQYQGVKAWASGTILTVGALFMGTGAAAQLHSIDFLRLAPAGSWFDY